MRARTCHPFRPSGPSCGALAALLLALAAPVPAAQVVVYPQPEHEGDPRSRYPMALLQLALARSGHDYQTRPSSLLMMQGRALAQLQEGHDVDVVWSMTDKEREENLLPVRIPIDRGLLGWRLLLVDARGAELLAKVQGVQDLKQLVAGQGHDWPDTGILRANGFTVKGSSTHTALFELLRRSVVDYLPRSAIEIFDELETPEGKGLSIAKGVMIRYPAALYFFVNKSNTRLAEDLQVGLERARRDGSFDKLFNAWQAQAIEYLRQPGLRVFELDNPLLPAATPLERKELWFER